jgi:hypothetical protein
MRSTMGWLSVLPLVARLMYALYACSRTVLREHRILLFHVAMGLCGSARAYACPHVLSLKASNALCHARAWPLRNEDMQVCVMQNV